jgi:hypothetical protein
MHKRSNLDEKCPKMVNMEKQISSIFSYHLIIGNIILVKISRFSMLGIEF